MARGSDSSTTIALGILILVAIAYLFKSSDTTISTLEDKINARFGVDVQSAVDRFTGVRSAGGGLAGLLYNFQQKFGTDLYPKTRAGAQIETGIDPIAAINAAGGATATYDTASVLSADEGGSGGMS